MNSKILIIGRVPPPIGGVSIHTQRLLKKLEEKNIEYHYLYLSIRNLLLMPYYFIQFRKFHLHTANTWIGFYVMILSKIFFLKSITTYHGNLGIHSKFKNKIDLLTLKLATHPILLNDISLAKAISYNKNAIIISSFIPPVEKNEILSNQIMEKIKRLKENHKFIFCTNASNAHFDKNNVEIYGITEVIKFFNENKEYGLIFSDPANAYPNIQNTDNVLRINELHSFYKVLMNSDASLRNTSTDGDSLSIKESLFLNKHTFCTDVIDRPDKCILYKLTTLSETIDSFMNSIITREQNTKKNIEDGSIKLIALYNSL